MFLIFFYWANRILCFALLSREDDILTGKHLKSIVTLGRNITNVLENGLSHCANPVK
jgi:hypothetical protein